VKKHSGASKAQVTMQVVDGTIHVLVSDQGVGFNPKEIKRREGLGTRSMAERAHLLGGASRSDQNWERERSSPSGYRCNQNFGDLVQELC
jgi:signal transduction histidine kinase